MMARGASRNRIGVACVCLAGILGSVLPRLTEADTALHNGDAAPRIAIWSHNDPVTLFGAALMGSGWTEIREVFESLASRFSNGTFEYEVIASMEGRASACRPDARE